MKTIKHILWGCTVLALLSLATACQEWTDIKPVDIEVQGPEEQNPEIWAHYMEILQAYKRGDHFLVYGKFANGAEKPTNGGQLLRSLPDSLDIVSLANADRMSAADREDLPLLREKGTRVLYCVNYAAQAAELSDAANLGAYLDQSISDAAALQLDGFSFTGIPSYGTEAEVNARREAAKLIVQKLSTVAGVGKDKLLVFEGNPAFLEDADLAKLNYLVLDTEKTANATDLKIQVGLALAHDGLTPGKLLLCGSPEGELVNEENVKQKALEDLVERVASLGPLAGLAVYDLGKAYYDPEKSYGRICGLIRKLNP
ncbi:MAG: glycoside hydrolase family 18 [Bacteroidales bacterium]|nr:glycoside hydrolase family 18 [Bacteroidales bacterium]MDY6000702.1 glycoside hydrolase family 18 [Candidatus Cryptobacteroides sp.]